MKMHVGISKVYRPPASVRFLLPCKLDIGSSTPCNKHPSKQVVKLRNRERARVQGLDERFWSQGLQLLSCHGTGWG